jgi:hypothetical protein
MNAPLPPFPINPYVGQWFNGWVWNGARWVSSPTRGIMIITQTFTANALYMPSPGLVTAIANTIGGGGGGGACSSTGTAAGGGGGAGSGGYSRKTLPAGLVAGGVNVIVGTGGSGSISGLEEGAGTPTSFGAYCVANGGLGGYANDGSHAFGAAGPGAAIGTGDLAFPGNPGQPGSASAGGAGNVVAGGAGGSIMGGAGISQVVGTATTIIGAPGLGYGSGGSGAAVNATPQLLVGGNGAPGICWVDEFCWADTADDCGSQTYDVAARVAVTGGGNWQPNQPYVDPRGGYGDD